MTDPGRLTLEDQLCFALYAATNAVTRAYRPRLQQIGLTYPQYLVLLALWQDGPAPASRIAGRLRLAPNAMTPLLDRLEHVALIRRDRDPDDRRVVVVSLTPTGAALEAAAARAQRAVVCDTQLGSAALAALRDELIALVRRMEPDRVGNTAPGGDVQAPEISTERRALR